MKILFIGGLFSEKQKIDVYKNSKAMPNMAANVHQWNIVNGLGANVDIINPLFVGNFPYEYKKIYLNKEEWSHYEGNHNISPPTINLFGIKQITRLYTLTKEIGKWIKKNRTDKVIVLYSLNTSFLFSLILAQFLYGRTKTCLIVPDLPLFYINNQGKSKIYRVIKKLDWIVMKKLSKTMDSYILLTKQMKEILDIGQKPYIVNEGICTDEKYNEQENMILDKSITYTGTIDREFGVLSLIKNFLNCAEADWVLNIAGGGNAQKDVVHYAKKDHRIKYWGVLTNEETKRLQRTSRILVNPRSSEEEFTKYSFPSKTMEYLKAGRPIIMHHLPGIPKDYDPYLKYFKNMEDDAILQGFLEIMSKSDEELNRIGENGKRFVETNKSVYVQGRKIKEFLTQIVHMY